MQTEAGRSDRRDVTAVLSGMPLNQSWAGDLQSNEKTPMTELYHFYQIQQPARKLAAFACP